MFFRASGEAIEYTTIHFEAFSCFLFAPPAGRCQVHSAQYTPHTHTHTQKKELPEPSGRGGATCVFFHDACKKTSESAEIGRGGTPTEKSSASTPMRFSERWAW